MGSGPEAPGLAGSRQGYPAQEGLALAGFGPEPLGPEDLVLERSVQDFGQANSALEGSV